MNLPRPTRRRWWLLGLLVLVGGLVAFGHVACVSLRGEGPSAGAADPLPYRPVVCFGYVDLEDRIRSLNPTVPGRVAEVSVRENDTVPAAAVLLRLEDTQAR